VPIAAVIQPVAVPRNEKDVAHEREQHEIF
jgi:hypothetical protein